MHSQVYASTHANINIHPRLPTNLPVFSFSFSFCYSFVLFLHSQIHASYFYLYLCLSFSPKLVGFLVLLMPVHVLGACTQVSFSAQGYLDVPALLLVLAVFVLVLGLGACLGLPCILKVDGEVHMLVHHRLTDPALDDLYFLSLVIVHLLPAEGETVVPVLVLRLDPELGEGKENQFVLQVGRRVVLVKRRIKGGLQLVYRVVLEFYHEELYVRGAVLQLATGNYGIGAPCGTYGVYKLERQFKTLLAQVKAFVLDSERKDLVSYLVYAVLMQFTSH